MTSQSPHSPGGGGERGANLEHDPESDLEYDLAHDAFGQSADQRAVGAPPPPDVVVRTVTPEYDGDFGYDQAHDVPGR